MVLLNLILLRLEKSVQCNHYLNRNNFIIRCNKFKEMVGDLNFAFVTASYDIRPRFN